MNKMVNVIKIGSALLTALVAYLALYFNMRPLITSSVPYYDQNTQNVIFSLENRNGKNEGVAKVAYVILSTNEEKMFTSVVAASNGKVQLRLYPKDNVSVPIPISPHDIKDHFHLLVLTESAFLGIRNLNRQVFYWNKGVGSPFIIQNINNPKYQSTFRHYFDLMKGGDMSLLTSFIISLIASILAVILTLYVDRSRLPCIGVTIEEEGMGYRNYVGKGRWKFIRVVVKNLKMPYALRWAGPRQTAENCKATLEFYDDKGQPLFSMRGRWASTPEIPYVPKDAILERSLYPDPVSISAGGSEVLDVVVQEENDTSAYGWNNEAYLNSWKTQRYRLPEGNYSLKINIVTQNGISYSDNFNLKIRKTIESTLLSN